MFKTSDTYELSCSREESCGFFGHYEAWPLFAYILGYKQFALFGILPELVLFLFIYLDYEIQCFEGKKKIKKETSA